VKYKVIKYLEKKDAIFNNLYALSQDGKNLKVLSSGEVVPVQERMVLKSLTAELKEFGLKTLYRKSWFAALPGTEKTSKRVKVVKEPKEKIPKAQKVKKRTKGLITATSKQLVSLLAHQQLEELVHQRIKLESTASNQEVFDGKTTFIRIVLHNVELNQLLVRIDCQNWRNGWWFYDLKTKQYKSFDKKVDKKGYGNENIIWPGF
jgi:hypothetical protein